MKVIYYIQIIIFKSKSLFLKQLIFFIKYVLSFKKYFNINKILKYFDNNYMIYQSKI